MSASSGLWKDRTMMTIDPARSLLLVIDFQVRLMPAIHEGELAVRNARRLTDAAALMGIPCLFTEQNAKGLGPTVDDLMVPQDRRKRCPCHTVMAYFHGRRSSIRLCLWP